MSYINIEFEFRTSLEQLLESLCHVDGFSVQGNLSCALLERLVMRDFQ